jgi:hypothetical protein
VVWLYLLSSAPQSKVACSIKTTQSYFVLAFPPYFHCTDITFYDYQGAYSNDKEEKQIKRSRNQREDMQN